MKDNDYIGRDKDRKRQRHLLDTYLIDLERTWQNTM